MGDKEKDLEKTAFGIAGMFGIYWFYSYFLKQYLPLSDGPKTVLGLILLYGVGPGILLSATKKVAGHKIEKRKISSKTILLCFLLQFTAVTVCIVSANIAIVLGFRQTSAQIDAASPHMIFMLLIFNPVAEELVFRKIFAEKLLRYGEGFYMLVSSFCFAIVHGVSLGVPQVIYTFLLGMLWSYLLVKSGDIKLAILMHSLSNLFGSVAAQALLGISMTAAGIYSMSLMLLGVAGLILFLASRKKIRIDDGPGIISKSAVKDLLCNRGIVSYAVLTLLVMLYNRLS